MNALKLLGLVSLATFGFMACSNPVDDQSRRGGGLEIPNGLQANVVVRLTDGQGAPLRNTSARVVAGESWGDRAYSSKDPTLHVVTTDSQGLVSIPVDESRVFLWSQNDSQGIYMPLRPADSLGNSRSNPLPLQARNLASINLIDAQGEPVGVFGTPFAFNQTTHSIAKVPSGDYMLVRKNDLGLQLGQAVEISEFDTVVDVRSMVFSDPNNLMLTNFQNRRVHNIWDPLHVGGYWWVESRLDTVESWDYAGIKFITDILDSMDGNIFAGIDVDFAGAPNGKAHIGLDFRTQPVNTNLSRATYVHFKAKGAGTWRLFIETQDTLGETPRKWFQAITLTDSWQEYRLALPEFECELCTGESWSAETRMGVNMFWAIEANGSIRLDDLVLEGLMFQDWVDP
jgi:hypothetical protein